MCSADVAKVLSYKKVTVKVLQHYAWSKKIQTGDNRVQLVMAIQKHWVRLSLLTK